MHHAEQDYCSIHPLLFFARKVIDFIMKSSGARRIRVITFLSFVNIFGKTLLNNQVLPLARTMSRRSNAGKANGEISDAMATSPSKSKESGMGVPDRGSWGIF